jgi:hypothetical protein
MHHTDAQIEKTPAFGVGRKIAKRSTELQFNIDYLVGVEIEW